MTNNGEPRRREARQWVILSALVLVGHWASTAVFDAFEDALEGEWRWSMAAVPLTLGGLFLVFAALYRERLTARLRRKARLTVRYVRALAIAAVTMLAAYGAAVSAERTFVALSHGWPVRPSHFWGGLTYWAAFVAGVILLFRHKDDLGAVTQFPVRKPSTQRPHLIAFLSDMRHVKHTNGVPDYFTDRTSNDIDADLVKLMEWKKKDPKARWPWEMPLRAIRHHIGALKEVTVVCSKESLVDAPWFLQQCRDYFPEEAFHVAFHVWAREKSSGRFLRIPCPDEISADAFGKYEAFDFEDLNSLSAAMFELLDTLTEQHNVPDSEITIDFTGGQKTTSLVAACVTFNRPLHAQYVRTDGKFEQTGDDIISFDLTVDPLAAGPG